MSTFETARLSGHLIKDQFLLLHEDVIYISEIGEQLLSPTYGSPLSTYQVIQLNKYDEHGNELGARDWGVHRSQDKGLEIIGFNILNDGQEDGFQDIFIQFIETTNGEIYSKMGNTNVGFNSNLLGLSDAHNGKWGFSNEIEPLTNSGFVVNITHLHCVTVNLQCSIVNLHWQHCNKLRRYFLHWSYSGTL